ncbi:MAG: hypothetical protein KAI57_03095 [Candidatus Pacebacteria bacterium]|nr:hypothetical protein [Candidatus Paceibacterota bacterium]
MFKTTRRIVSNYIVQFLAWRKERRRKNGNNKIDKMPQRYSLHVVLDKLQKKIEDGEGTHLGLSQKINSLMNDINSGNDSDVIRKTTLLLDYMKDLEIFSLDFNKIKTSLEKIR